jgi:NAD(P)H-hydrate epimerase
MKILTIENIRKADAYTIQHEPISSIDLMERASTQLFRWIKKRVGTGVKIVLFVGPGNNGGDGLALARMLAEKNYDVEVNLVVFTENTSADYNTNLLRLREIQGIEINQVTSKLDLKEVESDSLIVDAIFGSGLSRPAEGLAADVIYHVNNQRCVKVAIDIPSGLLADESSKKDFATIVRADYTLSFQMPKLAFMMPENDAFVGQWEILDIGLHSDFINTVETKNFLMLGEDIAVSIKPRTKFSHKGTYGHALLIAGSYGKMGAAVLAAKACLRSGVGLLHVHIPKFANQIMQIATPETMLSLDRYENYFSEVPDLSPFNVVGIGPGLGMEHQSQMALKLLIQTNQHPMVFDADALNILAENLTWLAFLPKNSVLTPHPREFERLVGKWDNDFHKMELQKQFAVKHGIVVVLKGAHTSVCLPSGNCYFNSTGNPGMATAGSGDVLTGIITGLIAQGYSSATAAIVGVYIHGLAADIAIKKTGMQALIASDIIENIGKAFLKV